MNQSDKASAFRALHEQDNPLILFNAWDAGSAQAVVRGGALAVGTSSWSIAAAAGFADGEKIDRDRHLRAVEQIAGAIDLPVTVDLESGFSEDIAGVGETVRMSIDAGAIGCNIEDSLPADGSLRGVAEAADRYRSARQAADAHCPGYFINARTDVFFRSPPETHNEAMLEEAIARSSAYRDAGVDGFFAPGLVDQDLIRRLAESIALPLNIMRLSLDPSVADLKHAGVSRISHGPYPYLVAMEALERAARDVR